MGVAAHTTRALALHALLLLALLHCSCVRAGFERGGAGDQGSCIQQQQQQQQQQQLQIRADQDDGEIDYNGTYSPQGEDGYQGDPPALYMGYWTDKGQGPTWTYLRFALTRSIPATATGLEARLQLHGLAAPISSKAWDPAQHALRVLVEDADDADVVLDGEQCPGCSQGRATVDAGVRWPASGGLSWTIDGDNTLPALGPALERLVQKRAGLASGAHVQLWIRGDFNQGSAEVASPDFGRPGYRPARLTLRWCE